MTPLQITIHKDQKQKLFEKKCFHESYATISIYISSKTWTLKISVASWERPMRLGDTAVDVFL